MANEQSFRLLLNEVVAYWQAESARSATAESLSPGRYPRTPTGMRAGPVKQQARVSVAAPFVYCQRAISR